MVPDPSFGSLLMTRRRRKDIILIRNIIWHTRRSQFGRLYWWPAPKTEQAACCQEKTGTFESKSKIMQTCNDVVFLDYLGTRTAFACSRRCHLVATTTTKCVHCWDKFTVGNYFISPRSGSTVRVAGYDMLECPALCFHLSNCYDTKLCFYLSNCYGTKCARNVLPAQRCQITGLPSQKIVSCKMSEGPPTCNTMRRIEEAASLSQVAAIVTRWMDGRSGRWQDHNWIGEHFQLFNISFSSLGRNKY